jgi:hypothetical protein
MSNSIRAHSSQINPQPPAKGSQMPPGKFKEARPRKGRTMNLSSKNITVRLSDCGGGWYRLKFQGKDTIARVKTEFVQAGIVDYGQPLSCNGYILDDKSTLDQYGINGDVIDVSWAGGGRKT